MPLSHSRAPIPGPTANANANTGSVRSVRHITTHIAAYAVLALGALVMLLPFYYMVVYASHTNTDILSVPPPSWFGSHTGANLADLLERRPRFWHSMGLSLWIAVVVTVLNLFFCSLAGYAFAMFEFVGKDKLFGFILATMLLPAFVSMIPTVLLMSQLGWINESRALIVPGACGAVGIFMMRQYISSAIPRELVEAARMDGCGEFSIYWRVVLPLLGPALGTLALVTFIGSYNNFIGALLVMRDQDAYTMPLVLRSLQGTSGITWGALAIGAAITVLPLLVLFVIYSRRLIDGLTAGAVKG
jgi:multiple sugar transport system permease protein